MPASPRRGRCVIRDRIAVRRPTRYAAQTMPEIDLADLMRQAQQMQETMSHLQRALEEQIVEGSSGAGMVKVKATGSQRIVAIEIDPAALQEDRDMVQDLLVAAVNNALERARELAQQRMSSMLPPGMIPPGTIPGL
jgi:nucleoid-associated protein EbfC